MAASDAAVSTGVDGVVALAFEDGALAIAVAAEGSDGSEAGTGGGTGAATALAGSTTAVAGGETGVCRLQLVTAATAARAAADARIETRCTTFAPRRRWHV